MEICELNKKNLKLCPVPTFPRIMSNLSFLCTWYACIFVSFVNFENLKLQAFHCWIQQVCFIRLLQSAKSGTSGKSGSSGKSGTSGKSGASDSTGKRSLAQRLFGLGKKPAEDSGKSSSGKTDTSKTTSGKSDQKGKGKPAASSKGGKSKSGESDNGKRSNFF